MPFPFFHYKEMAPEPIFKALAIDTNLLGMEFNSAFTGESGQVEAVRNSDPFAFLDADSLVLLEGLTLPLPPAEALAPQSPAAAPAAPFGLSDESGLRRNPSASSAATRLPSPGADSGRAPSSSGCDSAASRVVIEAPPPPQAEPPNPSGSRSKPARPRGRPPASSKPEAPPPAAPRPGLRLKKVNSRVNWNAALHWRFVAAVDSLGGADHATPTTILAAMPLRGLRLHHVKSHLQKYRRSIMDGFSLFPPLEEAAAADRAQ